MIIGNNETRNLFNNYSPAKSPAGKVATAGFEDIFSNSISESIDEGISLARTQNMGSVPNERADGSRVCQYFDMAKDGIIEYNGVIFGCDTDKNRITLGDVSDAKQCISVPLENGGCFVFNRDQLNSVSRAISMFSPEDINRILRAIATDSKCVKDINELEDEKNSIGEAQSKDNATALREKIEEMTEKLNNGEVEPKIQIGACELTIKEWDDMLEHFDEQEEEIREEILEEIKRRLEEYQTKMAQQEVSTDV